MSTNKFTDETKGFIGERCDADAGLRYLNARYCDPKLGLFIQPDLWEVTEQGVGDVTAHLGTSMPSGGGHIIRVHPMRRFPGFRVWLGKIGVRLSARNVRGLRGSGD